VQVTIWLPHCKSFNYCAQFGSVWFDCVFGGFENSRQTTGSKKPWGGNKLAVSISDRCRLLLPVAIFISFQAHAENFEQVLDRIASTHPQLAAARQTTRAGREDVSAARATYRPQFGITTDVGWIQDNNANQSGVAFLPEAKISQLVYDGGRTPAEIRRRKLRVELLGVQEQSVLSDLSLQLAEAWLDYSRASELVNVSEQQVAALSALHKQVVDIASFDRGRASDVVMVQSRLEQAQTTLETQHIAAAEARARISEIAATHIDPQGDVPDLDKSLPRNIEDCQVLADVSPSVRLADIQVAENNETVRGAKNWWLPQMAVEGARTSERTSDGNLQLFNAFAVRLRATMVPFDGGGGPARYRSAKATLASAQSNADLARNTLHEQVQRLWAFQAQRKARLPSLRDLVTIADDARNVVFEQFRIGRRTILDVLAYDLERFNARTQLVNERFDIGQTQYRLMGVLGRIYPAVMELPGQ